MADNKENVILIGLMGAGKTTIGKQLAKQLSKTFFDADQEIEKRTGVKIPVIFDLEGESGFRKRETSVLEELTQMHDIVLATGGGAVISPINRGLLKQHGLVIYLRATAHDLWLRMRHDKQRPLLQNVDVRAKLEALYHERHPIYMETADLVIDTGSQSAATVLHQIEKSLQQIKAT